MVITKSSETSIDNRLYSCPAYLFINYHLLNRSAKDIAEECNTCQSTIYFWLNKLNISRKLDYTNRFTEEHKQHIRESVIGKNHPLYNKHRSKLSKQRISKTLKGKYTGVKNSMYGKHLSEETKQKISIANTGRILSPEAKTKISKALKGKYTGSRNSAWQENWNKLSRWQKHKRMKQALEQEGIFKPVCCPVCNVKNKSIELMNLDHTYQNNSLDYYYLCHHCHDVVYHGLVGFKKNKNITPDPDLLSTLLQLQTREEREQLLKENILKVLENK